MPYDRVGEPADIGKVAVWLASDEADYITGTTIFVDGGVLGHQEKAGSMTKYFIRNYNDIEVSEDKQ